MDDAVEDGVGEGRFANQVMPAIDRDLAGDQGGAATVAVFGVSPSMKLRSGRAA
jgi:hypothetical protein